MKNTQTITKTLEMFKKNNFNDMWILVGTTTTILQQPQTFSFFHGLFQPTYYHFKHCV